MLFDAPGSKKVSLRGASTRATNTKELARLRDDRKRKRTHHLKATQIQAALRARADRRRAKQTLRQAFDAEHSSTRPAFSHARARALLFFHEDGVDDERWHWLMSSLLASARNAEPAANAAAAAHTSVDAAVVWHQQRVRLLSLCLRHLARTDGSSDGSLPIELEAALLLTDDDWHVGFERSSPVAADVLARIRERASARLSDSELHTAVARALCRALPSSSPPLGSHLAAALLSLSARRVALARESDTAAAVALAIFLLGCPALVPQLPSDALEAALLPHFPALVAALDKSLASLVSGLSAAPPWTGDDAGVTAVVPPPPRSASLCANLVSLAEAAGTTRRSSCSTAYVSVLHALLLPISIVLDSPSTCDYGHAAGNGATSVEKPYEASDEDSDRYDAGDADDPMQVCDSPPQSRDEAEWSAAAPEWRAALKKQLTLLPTRAHVGELLLVSLRELDVAQDDATARRWIVAAAHACSVLAQLLYGAASFEERSLRTGATAARPLPRAAAILNSLAFGAEERTFAMPALWRAIQRWPLAVEPEPAAVQPYGLCGALLVIFCSVFNQALVMFDDDELVQQPEAPTDAAAASLGLFSPAELASVARAVERCAIEMLTVPSAAAPPPAWRGALVRLVCQLYARDSRRSFMGSDAEWLAPGSWLPAAEAIVGRIEPEALQEYESHSLDKEIGKVAGGSSGVSGGGGSSLESSEVRRVASLLRHLPFAIPFTTRLGALRRWLSQRRELAAQASFSVAHGFGPQWHTITVSRASLLDDANAELHGLGPSQWQLPLRVRFLGLEGLEEAGVGEGVAKEFLVDVLKAGFDPEAGLFRTTHDGALAPDPLAARRRGVRDAESLYALLGAVLAKTLYEGILVELPLAPYFLNLLLGRINTFNDLPTLDPHLAGSLRWLKRYEGDFEPLSLNFAVDVDTGGGAPRAVPLVPGGEAIAVTRENRSEFVLRVAHYRLNTQLRRAVAAFARGFELLVPRQWIAMFSPAELQLILGGSDAPLNVDDWQQNAVYSGGYASSHPSIRAFWGAVRRFTPQQQTALLKFVTSCSRPPLMGFRWLTPPFCIHKAVDDNGGRLPTSATCMNLLKLPAYESEEILAERLAYAVVAGAGSFELS